MSSPDDKLLQGSFLGTDSRMVVAGVPLKEANDFVRVWHRHHNPVPGHRFSLAAIKRGAVCGVAIVGRPVSSNTCQETIVEVVRLATNGERNACSKLYGAAAREAKKRGFASIQTFTLPEEGGASLRAAGWENVGMSEGRPWDHRPGRVSINRGPKLKWRKNLD